ncbi:MAG: 4-hydroxy-tetrahydrodipicolinate synthase [Methylotenera sp.]|nr:4-hydroxy-tetrahydrodipicolinate synthase [Oligoflexia bacterium]
MRGVYTAVITPFTAFNEVDYPALKKILQDQKEAGISGVVACGTTGETPCLSSDEKKKVIQTCIAELKGSATKVLAGTGTNNTPETIAFSKWASDQGVDGILVVTPYYNKPSPLGLEEHFLKVADAVSCEIMLYNVPGRTGTSLTIDTLCKLAAHPRIRSLKEATGNVELTSQIIDALELGKLKLDILSGDDATYLPLLSVGACGVVSVASNLFPRGMVAIQKAMDSQNVTEARRLHQKFYPLFRDLFVESNPVPVKFCMAHLGFGETHVRAPLVKLTAPSEKKLTDSMKRCGIEAGGRF